MDLSSVNWKAEFELKSCNEMWEFFRDKIHTLAHQYVAYRLRNKRENVREKNHWITRKTLKTIKIRK